MAFIKALIHDQTTYDQAIPMKISWTSLKVSIAGAKLSHLVQKDEIWDHGSMIEQLKTVFYKLKKAKSNGNIEDLKKYLTAACYEKLGQEMDALERTGRTWVIKNLFIKEAAVVKVSEGKNNKPDCFTAVIKTIGIEIISDKDHVKELINYSNRIQNFSEHWTFVRIGDWWALDGITLPRKIHRQ